MVQKYFVGRQYLNILFKNHLIYFTKICDVAAVDDSESHLAVFTDQFYNEIISKTT